MTDHARSGSLRRPIALAPFAAVAILIAIFLLRDASAFVNSARDELIGHLGASAGLTVAVAGALLVLLHRRPPLPTVLIGGAAMTFLLEVAQVFAPNRGFELRDLASGLGGVLVAGLCVEFVLYRFDLPTAQGIHSVIAVVASLVLAVMLVFDLAPETLEGAAPDGTSCPLTTIDGQGERIVLGETTQSIDNRCLRSSVGGLGLFGPDDVTSLTNESILISSPLDQLGRNVLASERLDISTEFVTDGFILDDEAAPGVIMSLRSSWGELLQLRTRNQTTEVVGPSLAAPYRSVSYTEALLPNTRHQLRVELTADTMTTFIDGQLVATNTVDPAWLDVLGEPGATEDLTLYIGNSPSLALPFGGLIEWIEIST